MPITERTIRSTLRKLAVPIDNKGYEYLVQAFLLVTSNPNKPVKTKEIYETLSKRERVTPRTIESSLHDVIKKTVTRLDYSSFCLYFGASPKQIGVSENGSMKVATFIGGISEYLYLENGINKYKEEQYE